MYTIYTTDLTVNEIRKSEKTRGKSIINCDVRAETTIEKKKF
jgi:hypothetical protein